VGVVGDSDAVTYRYQETTESHDSIVGEPINPVGLLRRMALIPPGFFDCVVAIGNPQTGAPTNWVATGFVYGKFIRQHPDGRREYRIYLVTNRHVASQLKMARLRFNPVGSAPAKEYDLVLVDGQGKAQWYTPNNPNADVAVVPIDYAQLERDGIAVRFFSDVEHAAKKPRMVQIGVAEGDFVYVLGFPFGDVGGSRSYVVARSGSLARVRDTLSGTRQDFLVDVTTFPGNSGGPIILKPEVVSIQGTPANSQALLIGVTALSINYLDEAVSKQTGETRVTFQDNSGLSIAFPIDFVDEAIQHHLATLPPAPVGTPSAGTTTAEPTGKT